jgi:hypothetical protein
MKDQKVLMIFNRAPESVRHAWEALLSKKYIYSLGFTWAFTDSLEEAHIIAWDGLRTAKNGEVFDRMVLELDKGKALILHREAFTLFKDHGFAKFLERKGEFVFELYSANLLPEDILFALDQLQKKMIHV